MSRVTSRLAASFDRYSAMPLNDLPVELVALILPHNLRPIQFRDHEERTRELLSYACSCRALRAAAETLLWTDVIVATPHQAGALLSALYRDKRGSRIRSLHVGSTRDGGRAGLRVVRAVQRAGRRGRVAQSAQRDISRADTAHPSPPSVSSRQFRR